MIDQWLQNLSEMITSNAGVSLGIAFLAGILSSFTPCALSSIPLVIGYVGGCADNRKKALVYSLFFCVGLAIAFTVLGVVAVFVGRLFMGIQLYWYIILGLLMLLMALEMWGVTHILPQRCGYRTIGKKGIWGAIGMGMLGAVFASPCTTPVLIAIMAIVSTWNSIGMGIGMLLLYSIGHSLLLLIAGTSTGFVREVIHSQRFEKVGVIVKIVVGILLFLFAIVLFYSAFSALI